MLCKTVSSLQPDVGRGFLHVSNVFLYTPKLLSKFRYSQFLNSITVLAQPFYSIMA